MSTSAIGLLATERMSLRTPPMPVEAPPYGSTAEGWLWLSMCRVTTYPSADVDDARVVPGPRTTLLPLVGKSFRRALEDL